VASPHNYSFGRKMKASFPFPPLLIIMKPLIVANWKCNPTTLKESKQLFDSIKKGVKNIKSTEVVICPPFVYLSAVAGVPFGSEGGLALGAQNCFWEEKGAYTGEISVPMLKNLGIKYVIIGHSERRKYFRETDKEINKKIKKAVGNGLKVILCVGESEEEWKQGPVESPRERGSSTGQGPVESPRERGSSTGQGPVESPRERGSSTGQGKKSQVLKLQLENDLNKITRDEMKSISIAYEPVWAIGTGNNCSVGETMKSILFIRQTLTNIYNRETADKTRILYGGSVNGENSGPYIKEALANGLLVGGASLKAEEFVKIVKSAV